MKTRCLLFILVIDVSLVCSCWRILDEHGTGAWSLFLAFRVSLARQITAKKRSSPEMSLRSCNPPVESGHFYQRVKTDCGLSKMWIEHGLAVINGQETYRLK